MINREDASALADLQFHWDEVYDITASPGSWLAVLKDDRGVVLRADDAWSLRMLIRDDYAQRAERMIAERRREERGEPDPGE